MIVNSNETKAVLTGNMEVTRGSISLNKETFGLIIKGIYEDKVLASCVNQSSMLWTPMLSLDGVMYRSSFTLLQTLNHTSLCRTLDWACQKRWSATLS